MISSDRDSCRLPAPLDPAFYSRPATVVAEALLGKLIVRDLGNATLAGRIVETEAYAGDIDEASHSFRGPTPRNRSMFGPAGHAYVYRSYGVHSMLNIVTTMPGGSASAVLVRGLEPLCGIDTIRKLRGVAQAHELLRGPGNVGKGLAINSSLDGHDLSVPPLRVVDGPPPEEAVVRATRIGITRSVALPWRFYLRGSPSVSRRDRAAESAVRPSGDAHP